MRTRLMIAVAAVAMITVAASPPPTSNSSPPTAVTASSPNANTFEASAPVQMRLAAADTAVGTYQKYGFETGCKLENGIEQYNFQCVDGTCDTDGELCTAGFLPAAHLTEWHTTTQSTTNPSNLRTSVDTSYRHSSLVANSDSLRLLNR